MTFAAAPRYDSVAIALHWLIALLVVGLFLVGLSVDYFPKPVRPVVINLHAVFGTFVLVLAALRIFWRVTHKAPPPPANMGPLFRKAAAAGHGLLYIATLATPIIGLVGFFLHGTALNYGVFQIPSPLAANHDLHEAVLEYHQYWAYSLVGLATAHALVALYHQLVLRDDLLTRMRPR